MNYSPEIRDSRGKARGDDRCQATVLSQNAEAEAWTTLVHSRVTCGKLSVPGFPHMSEMPWKVRESLTPQRVGL